MTLKVIGSGFGRTGTMSTKIALEKLGFGPCHHMVEVMENPPRSPRSGRRLRMESLWIGPRFLAATPVRSISPMCRLASQFAWK